MFQSGSLADLHNCCVCMFQSGSLADLHNCCVCMFHSGSLADLHEQGCLYVAVWFPARAAPPTGQVRPGPGGATYVGVASGHRGR